MKYDHLSPTQRNEICNGCGGKGGLIKPPHRIFFETSCNKHDFSYYLGCTEKDRLKADKGFYQAMKQDCESLPWYQYARYRPWCWVYYKAVRRFGRKFFYYGDKKRKTF